MSDNNDLFTYILKIEKILKWSEDEKNEWFKTDFVENLKENVDKYQSITPKQMKAVDNIITKCKIMSK